MAANDTGKRIVELDEELVAFAIDNCDANHRLGMNLLQASDNRGTEHKLVDLLDKFKRLKAALEAAR